MAEAPFFSSDATVEINGTVAHFRTCAVSNRGNLMDGTPANPGDSGKVQAPDPSQKQWEVELDSIEQSSGSFGDGLLFGDVVTTILISALPAAYVTDMNLCGPFIISDPGLSLSKGEPIMGKMKLVSTGGGVSGTTTVSSS